MKIAILPGDGIGPEITSVVERIVAHLDERFGLALDLETLPVGLLSLARQGSTFTAEDQESARQADGVILGPMSTYEYPPPERGGVNPSAALRKGLDLYANIRPARNLQGVPAKGQGIDLIVVRENTEGFYSDRNMYQGLGEFMPSEDMAISMRRITRACCERIARCACEMAMDRRRHLTLVHKANVFHLSDGLFKSVVMAVAENYPQLAVDEMLIDAMAAALVRRPEDFDVIVTTNMYGDILSDLAVELSGGLGLGGALNAGDEHAMAQATHGSAPDIAGQNRANPVALLLSTAMLLRWLGHRHQSDQLMQASGVLENGVFELLSKADCHTADLGGPLSTEQFGVALLAALG